MAEAFLKDPVFGAKEIFYGKFPQMHSLVMSRRLQLPRSGFGFGPKLRPSVDSCLRYYSRHCQYYSSPPHLNLLFPRLKIRQMTLLHCEIQQVLSEHTFFFLFLMNLNAAGLKVKCILAIPR